MHGVITVVAVNWLVRRARARPNQILDRCEVPAAPTPPADPQGADEGTPWLSVVSVIALGATALVVALGAGYSRFRNASSTPTPLSDTGDIRLFFDRPGVPAIVDVTARELAFGGLSAIDVNITVTAEFRPSTVGFTLAVWGAARTYDDPLDVQPFPNGCRRRISVIPDDGLRCSEWPLDLPGVDNTALSEPAQIISGTIRRNDVGAMFSTVLLTPRAVWSRTAGSRTYFRLPQIGTTYLPRDGRDLYVCGFGSPARYVPATLGVTFDYRPLAPNERVETVAPALPLAGQLAWIESDVSTLHPTGSLTDLTADAERQRELFILAALVGVIPGLVMIVTQEGAHLVANRSRRRRKPRGR